MRELTTDLTCILLSAPERKRLATAVDVDATTLARWERGTRAPSGNYERRVQAILVG